MTKYGKNLVVGICDPNYKIYISREKEGVTFHTTPTPYFQYFNKNLRGNIIG